jgi:CBS domain-containing protein
MTIEVVVAQPTTPVQQVARLLADHCVSALPVVDGRGRVLGVVPEVDLLGDSRPLADEQPAATAGAAMTSPAVTVSPVGDRHRGGEANAGRWGQAPCPWSATSAGWSALSAAGTCCGR